MCWIGKVFDLKIADKDISCYKIVEIVKKGLAKPIYRPDSNIYYSVGIAYNSSIEVDNYIRSSQKIPTLKITKGFHSYNSKSSCIYEINNSNFGGPKRLGILECIIPEGTIYFENLKNEIVSNCLEVKRLIPYKKEVVSDQPAKMVS